jgi:two-component system CheB/CheR fusion protein
MITGNSDVRMAVEAMKIGAVDFIEKPVNSPALLASIERVLERLKDTNGLQAWRIAAAKQMAALSPRQHEIMKMVLSGEPSKVIAARLGISQRTVESHRATIMKKTGCKSLPELARLSLAAISTEPDIAITRHKFPRELLERLLQ